MEETNIFPSSKRPLLQKPRSISIPRIRSQDEFNVSTPLTPNRTALRATRAYQIDQEALQKYKRILVSRAIWASVFLFLVIVERVFADYLRTDENNLIIWLQDVFKVTYYNSNFFLQPVVFLENYLYFCLLLTHFFIILYYFYNAVICLKIMFTAFNVMALVSLLEIVFGDPRPYWHNDQIVGAGCEVSYGFPSFTIFCVLFIFLYTWYCFEEDEDDESPWDRNDKIKCFLFILFFSTYCFLKVLSGFDYISQILLSVLYAFLFYYLAIFMDKTVTKLVEKSSIDVQAAKAYSIFWMVYILIFAALSIVIYVTANAFFNINWFSNYFNCLEKYQETKLLQDTPYDHLIGAWGSFLKTVTLFALLGAVFGAAKAFRDFKGILWYATTTKNKTMMTAIAHVCVLPSWILVSFQSLFIGFFEKGGIDSYLFNAVHFAILYAVIFGALPKLIFKRLNLLNQDAGFYVVADEMIKLDSSDIM